MIVALAIIGLVLGYLAVGIGTAVLVVKLMNIDLYAERDGGVVFWCLVFWPVILLALTLFGITMGAQRLVAAVLGQKPHGSHSKRP